MVEQAAINGIRKRLCILSVLSMIFVTVLLCSDIILYKIVDILGVGLSLSVFSSPVSYAVGNIITECFGKFTGILMVVSGVSIELFAGLGISFSSHLANQFNHFYQQSFMVALGELGKLAGCGALAGLFGYTVNVYILVHLKKISILNEFIVRAIIATFAGELVFAVVAYSLWFWKSPLHFSVLMVMLMLSFIFKLLFAFVYSILGSYAVGWINSGSGGMVGVACVDNAYTGNK